MRRPETVLRPARVHLPLHRTALCLDCEVCFELGPDRCPACGSETWVALSRFLADRSRRPAAQWSLAS